jgi:hypothetical protein
MNSVKGIVERIDDNDDPKKRSSERASVQLKLPSDKVKEYYFTSLIFIFNK